jgi:hypothetical protein
MRDGVYTVTTEGVATQKSPTAEPCSAPGAMRADGFRHVLRAGRVKATRARKQGGKKQLVAPKKYEEPARERCVDSSAEHFPRTV